MVWLGLQCEPRAGWHLMLAYEAYEYEPARFPRIDHSTMVAAAKIAETLANHAAFRILLGIISYALAVRATTPSFVILAD